MAELVDSAPLDPEADAGHTLRQYVSAVWKRRFWILLLVALGVGGGWLKGRLAADVYSVRTEIDITKQRPFGLSPMGGSQVVSFGEGYLESQLHYPTRYKLLASGRYITTLLQSRAAAGGSIQFPWWDWLTWPAWSSEFPWNADDPSGRGTPAKRSALEAQCGPPIPDADAFERLVGIAAGEFRRRFAFRAYGPLPTRDPASPFATPEDLRSAFESHVAVEPVKGTALVDIELDGERPLVLAPLLNLLIETFSREQRTEGQKRLAIERDLVDQQLKGLDDDTPGPDGQPPARSLRVARKRLEAWIGAHDGNDANRIELRRRVRASQVEEAEREIRALSDLLTKAHGELRDLTGDEFADGDDAASDRRNAATLRRRVVEITKIGASTPEGAFHRLPFVLHDRTVADFFAKLEALGASRTAAGPTLRDLNVAVRQVALDKALTIAQSLDVRAAKRDQYAADRDDLNRSWALGNELAELQSEVDRRTKDLLDLNNRRDTIRTQESVESGLQPLKVVEPATDPWKPVRPNRTLLLLMGAGVGLLLGLTLAVLLDWLDDTVSDPADVERYLRAPVLGTIVTLKPGQDGVREIDRIATKLPRSPISEAFRAIRTSVEFLGTETDGEGGRVLLVSSCSPREGKTTVASNLASVLAQDGKRTLLVDADMRRPRVHQVYGIANAIGLSNVIAGKARLEDAVVGTDQENLWVLPSGATPPNPAELLGRKATDALLLRLAREFDRVVIDTPPVGVVTDAAVLGRRVGQVLLVVAAGRTKRRAAEHGESLLRSAGKRPSGVVMNQVARSSRFLYGGYYHKDAAAYYGAADDTRP